MYSEELKSLDRKPPNADLGSPRSRRHGRRLGRGQRAHRPQSTYIERRFVRVFFFFATHLGNTLANRDQRERPHRPNTPPPPGVVPDRGPGWETNEFCKCTCIILLQEPGQQVAGTEGDLLKPQRRARRPPCRRHFVALAKHNKSVTITMSTVELPPIENTAVKPTVPQTHAHLYPTVASCSSFRLQILWPLKTPNWFSASLPFAISNLMLSIFLLAATSRRLVAGRGARRAYDNRF